MRGVSLFAGIGGFDLAMERCGIEVTHQAEIDKPCQGVLSRHFPCTTLFDNVTEVYGDELCDPDIITAGWPCQGNSVAGLRKGLDDPRSRLWWATVDIVRDARPRWFVGENVPGLLTVRGGADFYEVIKSLDELGYGVAWRVLDAQNFGVPQRRRRVLIVGCLGDPTRAAQVLFEPESGAGDSEAGREAGAHVALGATVSTIQGGGRRGYRIDAESAAGGHLRVAHTLTSGVAVKPGVNPPGRRNEDDYNLVCVTGSVTHTLRAEGADASEDGTGRGTPIINALLSHHGRNNPDQPWVCSPVRASNHYGDHASCESQLVPYVEGVRRLTPLECERLQGFPDNWTAEQSDSARYRQLGNAVAVPMAEWVIRRIVSTSNQEAA